MLSVSLATFSNEIVAHLDNVAAEVDMTMQQIVVARDEEANQKLTFDDQIKLDDALRHVEYLHLVSFLL